MTCPHASQPLTRRVSLEEFIETARKLGMDESREAFERAIRRVTSKPVVPERLEPSKKPETNKETS
jgi:hypothetical protein